MSKTGSLFAGPLYQKYLKRLIDIVLSLIILAIFSPFWLITAIAIKLDSPGPTLFLRGRVGQNESEFQMYKFRSMIINAHDLLHSDPQFKELFEEYKKSSYKLKNDPRITKVGKFIRRHSIDEIPQFLNVLRGDMSVVGPRAYYPDELENQQKEFPGTKEYVRKVLSVKPGITGLWQVSGRSEVNFDKRIMLDAQYVETISLWSDLLILFKTPLVMLTGKGAV